MPNPKSTHAKRVERSSLWTHCAPSAVRWSKRALLLSIIFIFGACGSASEGSDNADCIAQDDTCRGDNICVSGLCEDAFTRAYQLYIQRLTAPLIGPDGLAWDGDDTLVDPFVRVYLDDQPVCTTAASINSNTASYTEPCTLRPTAGSELRLEAWDQDSFFDDFMFKCTMILDADALRHRAFNCNEEYGTIRSAIVPSGE